MTFDPNVPLNSDSPAIFPPQNRGNMGRLQTIISADHQLNLTAAANDGYHNIVHLTQQAPSGVLAATGRVFVKSVSGVIQLFYMNDAGIESQITPTIPIHAAVNFFGNPVSIRYGFNVSSVVRNSSGDYTISFTTALPSNNYVVTGMCMRDITGGGVVQIKPDANYSAVVTTTFVRVLTVSLGNVPNDMQAVFIQISGG
jgi:hypothetical protein